MPLELQTRTQGDVTLISLHGRIVYGEETVVLREVVKKLLVTSHKLVLNLAGVSYVDSGGIGTLVGLFHSATACGSELKLAAANDKVLHVFEITRLLPVLGLYPSEQQAVDSFSKQAQAVKN